MEFYVPAKSQRRDVSWDMLLITLRFLLEGVYRSKVLARIWTMAQTVALGIATSA